MVKKLATLAIAALSICGFNAMAQCPGNNENCTAGENNKMYQPRQFTDFAFEGILLDIDQQAKIDSINAVYVPNGPVCREAKPCDKDACQNAEGKKDCKKADCKKDCKKSDCKKADCKKADCKKDCKKADCKKDSCDKRVKDFGPRRMGRHMGQGMTNKSEYVAAVKEVLTPEQYVVFLENIVNMPQRPAPGMMMHHNMRHGKDMKGACSMQPCDKAAKAPKSK